MKQYIYDMLYIISCAVHDKTAVLRDDMDIDSILFEAYGQSCLLWCITALLNAANHKSFPFIKKHEKVITQKKEFERKRRRAAYKLIQLLTEQGLNPIIIKGECLAALYPDPLLRESVDTDIFFIDAKNCEKAFTFICNNGGKPADSGEGKHTAVTYHDAGRVELHHSLFDKDFYELHLQKEMVISEPTEKLQIGSYTLTTLGKNSSVKYILCHMIHHFLFNRCDMRQIFDVLVYIRAYKNEIDTDELMQFLKNTHYKGIFDAIIGVGIQYLGFTKEELYDVNYSPSIVEEFLSDIFNGCIKGLWTNNSEKNARGFGVFEVELSNKKRTVLHRIPIKRIVNVLIPKKELLFSQFEYCKRNRMLIPIAWANNIFDVAKGAAAVNAAKKRRYNLLARLGIWG